MKTNLYFRSLVVLILCLCIVFNISIAATATSIDSSDDSSTYNATEQLNEPEIPEETETTDGDGEASGDTEEEDNDTTTDPDISGDEDADLPEDSDGSNDEANEDGYVVSLAGTNPITPATLLAGNSPLKADTLEETIKNYDETYLLGIASEFCVFLRENFEVTESDTEGYVAVGGDIIVSTPWETYTIGAGDYWTHTSLDQLNKYREGAATVIMGGQLKGKLNDIYYKDGSVYESDTAGDDNRGNPILKPEEKSNKKLDININMSELPEDYPLQDIPEKSEGNWQSIDQSQTYVTKLLDFDEVFAKLISTSKTMAQNRDNTEITWDDTAGTITFTYTGTAKTRECVYFNLSSEDYVHFQNASTVAFENIPKLPNPRAAINNDGTEGTWEYSYIIVNVEGKGEIHIANPDKHAGVKGTSINGKFISREFWEDDNSKNNDPGVTSLLYNFYEADKVVIGNNFQGTIFAPGADVTDEFTVSGSDRGHLSGALIANSFKGATQFGYRTFTGYRSMVTTTFEETTQPSETIETTPTVAETTQANDVQKTLAGPKTGDNRNIAAWMLMMAAAMLVMVVAMMPSIVSEFVNSRGKRRK